MGVHGLWGLLETAGKPVPLETLENKILAIDVSIWLHQAVKGFRDQSGQPLPNGHLLGLFHRICKLLFYKIKPVFVFDGGIPIYKRQTMANRKQKKDSAASDARKLSHHILKNYLQQNVIGKVLGKQPSAVPSSASHDDDVFHLAPLGPDAEKEMESDGEAEEYGGDLEMMSESSHFQSNIHDVDVMSEEFAALPSHIQHEVLLELKDTRKQSSWNKLHQMPKESGNFSSFQMDRLLRRRALQAKLEKIESEMGSSQLQEAAEGLTPIDLDSEGQRIVSEDTLRFVLKKLTQSEKAKKPQSEHVSLSNETVDYSTSSIIKKRLTKDMKSEVAQAPSDSGCDDDPEDYSLDNNVSRTENFSGEQTDLSQEEIYLLIQQNAPVALGLDRPILSKKDEFHKPTQDRVSRNDIKLVTLTTTEDKDIGKEFFAVQGQTPSEPTLKKAYSTKLSDESGSTSWTSKLVETPSKVELPSDSKQEHFITVEITSLKTHSAEEDIFADVFKEAQRDDIIKLESILQGFKKEIQTSRKTESLVKETETKEKEASSFAFHKSESRFNERSDLHSSLSTLEKDEGESLPVMRHFQSAENMGAISINKTVSEEDGNCFMIVSNRSCSDMEKDIHEASASQSLGAGFQQLSSSINSTNETTSEEECGKSKVLRAVAPNFVATSKDVKNMENNKEESENNLRNMPEEDQNLLEEYSKQLEIERRNLEKQRGRQERLATSLSDQMYLEAQELLQLFGLPYVTSPMEAEAQCAFLDILNLTQGTITDDSDIWLFGGQRVYRNFFNQTKHVEFYHAENIFKYFQLTREKMINLALLCGSDYTDGIRGVGPVTAMEILLEFPGDGVECLETFQQWWTEARTKATFVEETPVKKKLLELEISKGFPHHGIVEAYLKPEVDESSEEFSWSSPDIDGLREFARKKMGWSKSRTDEVLAPVIKRMNLKEMQSRIDSYFQVKLPEEVKLPSKRLTNILKRAKGGENIATLVQNVKTKSKKSIGRGRGKRSCKEDVDDDDILEEETLVSEIEGESPVASQPSTSCGTSSKMKLQGLSGKASGLVDLRALAKEHAKQRAIEIFRKSQGMPRKQPKRKVSVKVQNYKLSESSSDYDDAE